MVEVDTTNAVCNDNKIPGISLINNFLFEEDGIRTWKAYNVGPGHYLAYGELSFKKQEGTGLKVIQLFSPRMKERGTVLESTRPRTEIFSCVETGSVLTFKTEAEAYVNMDSGQHVRELESESGYDTIRKKWTEKKKQVQHFTTDLYPQIWKNIDPKDGPSKLPKDHQE